MAWTLKFIKIINYYPMGIGEILIGGEGLAREYYKRSELTEEKFF